ncbi:hypothetical protein [Kribbella sp. NPDC051620]|uniref:hypothetical protein n=1 Tax=Kribbella sp. NPDC051620 TaxID=3364120 RepID=UPI00379BCD5A
MSSPQGYGPPPKRSNTGAIIGVVAAVVLVLMTIGGLIVIMQGEGEGPTPSEPKAQSNRQPGQGAPTNGSAASTPAAGAPRLTEATALAGKFVGLLSVNKQKEAAALGCEGSKQLLPTSIMLIVDEQTKLKLSGTTTVEEPGTSAYPMRMDLVPISGKTRFGPMSGFVRIQDVPGEPLCVRIFQLK